MRTWVKRDYTKPEHTVVDLCMRHGITAVAAQLERRSCIGIEIEKQSYDLAVGRFTDQFGVTTPVRASPLVASPLPIVQIAAPLPDTPLPDAPLPDVHLAATLLAAPLASRIKPSLKKHVRICGTPGCMLPDNHIGLCSCATMPQKRTRNALEA